MEAHDGLVALPLCQTDEDALVEPVKRPARGLELRRGAKIIRTGIHRLAARHALHHLRWPMAQAAVHYLDERAISSAQRVARRQLQHTVRPYVLPVGSAGQDLAAQAGTFDLSAQD